MSPQLGREFAHQFHEKKCTEESKMKPLVVLLLKLLAWQNLQLPVSPISHLFSVLGKKNC